MVGVRVRGADEPVQALALPWVCAGHTVLCYATHGGLPCAALHWPHPLMPSMLTPLPSHPPSPFSWWRGWWLCWRMVHAQVSGARLHGRAGQGSVRSWCSLHFEVWSQGPRKSHTHKVGWLLMCLTMMEQQPTPLPLQAHRVYRRWPCLRLRRQLLLLVQTLPRTCQRCCQHSSTSWACRCAVG